MLSRAMQVRRHNVNKSPTAGGGGGGEGSSRWSVSQFLPGDEDEALPWDSDACCFTFCETSGPPPPPPAAERAVTLREVMMYSVQLMGKSGLGTSEKAVLQDGAVFSAKRFRRVVVGKRRYGKYLERLAQVSGGCEYLVPIRAYIYTKRIKMVLSDYYAMGSLADLLEGARERGHTPLSWEERLKIIIHVARAISFIHNQTSAHKTRLEMNVHGNIKTSNVFIKIDFSACLSDYGFVQLAERTDPTDFSPSRKLPEFNHYDNNLKKEGDIYNFGVVILDILGGPAAPLQVDCILKQREEIKHGRKKFFEFDPQGSERRQAFRVLEIALALTSRSAQTRPSINTILEKLEKL